MVRLIMDAGAAIRAQTRDTRRVAHADVVQVNEDFGDECRVYVIGRRSSLNVSRYRDFLRRNRVDHSQGPRACEEGRTGLNGR